MRTHSLVGLAAASLVSACTTGGTPATRDAGMDGGGAVEVDAGAASCATAAECDDGLACTVDGCGVGNVCRHMPLDALCAAGERCVEGVGCRAGMATTCEVDADCQDGAFCNGAERCIGPSGSRTCVIGTPVDCDDGNACTTDACDEALAGCAYTSVCDAGVVGVDAGTPCDPFMPSNYPGNFTFRPSALSACVGSGTYNIAGLTIDASGGALRVTADRFTLTQSPAPTDGSFDVRFSDTCGTYRLVGSFSCADRWSGTWTATFSGECAGLCADQTLAVRGSRR